MVRVMRFDGDHGAKRRQWLRDAFVAGGNNPEPNTRKSVDILRREIVVMGLLEDALAALSPSVTLDQPQYEMLKRHIDALAAVTPTSNAGAVVDLIDWIASIDPSEPDTKKAARK